MKRFIIALAILFSFNSVCYASVSQTEKDLLCRLSIEKLDEFCSGVYEGHKEIVTLLEKMDFKSMSKETLIELLKVLKNALKEEGNTLESIKEIIKTTKEIMY